MSCSVTIHVFQWRCSARTLKLKLREAWTCSLAFCCSTLTYVIVGKIDSQSMIVTIYIFNILWATQYFLIPTLSILNIMQILIIIQLSINCIYSSSCQAVLYCSKECQKKDWSQKGQMAAHCHKNWCKKMKTYMSKSDLLKQFPFTFAQGENDIFSLYLEWNF
jgi:hypothetical protein